MLAGGVLRVELPADPQVSGPLIEVERRHHDVLEVRVAGGAHDLQVKARVGPAVVHEAALVAGVVRQGGGRAQFGDVLQIGPLGGQGGGLRLHDRPQLDQVAEALQ